MNSNRTPWLIGSGVAVLLLCGAALLWRAESRTNKVALAESPKPVSYVEAKKASYRARRTYVGTLEPWVMARVGPQFITAYVDTVLVRPGATVKKGEVLATLDCRNASAQSQAVAMQARAIDARQQALAHEAARTQGMLGGGFVSENAAEQITAQSTAEQAELEAIKAKLTTSHLEVSDCVLRAPFNGEIASRTMDPGAFARPGSEIVSVVDRSIIRLTGEAPERDFDAVAPGVVVNIHCVATGRDLKGTITRRAPSADPETRTVHFEIDLADPERELPVGTTGEIRIEVGEAIDAVAIPTYAAAIRGQKATVYVIEAGNVAHSHTHEVLGEDSGKVYIKPSLAAGSQVVTEGRETLNDGDHVSGKVDAAAVTVDDAVTPKVPEAAP